MTHVNWARILIITALCLVFATATNERNSNETGKNCIEPGSSKICSGNGVCESGKCQCWELDEELDPLYKYSGQYCEECPYCRGQRCLNFLPCLECVYRDALNASTKCSEACEFKYVLIDTISSTPSEKLCETDDNYGCFITFKYSYSEQNGTMVYAKRKKDCYEGYTSKKLFTPKIKYSLSFVPVLGFSLLAVIAYIMLLCILMPRCCDSCGQQRMFVLVQPSMNNYPSCDVVRYAQRSTT